VLTPGGVSTAQARAAKCGLAACFQAFLLYTKDHFRKTARVSRPWVKYTDDEGLVHDASGVLQQSFFKHLLKAADAFLRS
jgi:hypothetical protein